MNSRLPIDANSSSLALNRKRWRLPLMLALLLAVIVLAKSSGLHQNISTHHGDPSETISGPSPAAPTGQTVTLAIRFADGNERHDYVAWRADMTVEDLLSAASRLPKGVQFAQQGSGESALLTEINGIANQGSGARNWTYSVNGQEADRSFAIYKLQPGDHVLWTFAEKQ
jgi:Domain of unknown function (DUF4430)